MLEKEDIAEMRRAVEDIGKEINANFEEYRERINKRFDALKNAIYQYLELASSMGLSTIKANLKTI